MNQLEDASKYSEAALARDPFYALPYGRLAIIRDVQGKDEAGKELLAKAHSLGHRRRSKAQAKSSAQSLQTKLNSIIDVTPSGTIGITGQP